jgi:hypothetical protein
MQFDGKSSIIGAAVGAVICWFFIFNGLPMESIFQMQPRFTERFLREFSMDTSRFRGGRIDTVSVLQKSDTLEGKIIEQRKVIFEVIGDRVKPNVDNEIFEKLERAYKTQTDSTKKTQSRLKELATVLFKSRKQIQSLNVENGKLITALSDSKRTQRDTVKIPEQYKESRWVLPTSRGDTVLSFLSKEGLLTQSVKYAPDTVVIKTINTQTITTLLKQSDSLLIECKKQNDAANPTLSSVRDLTIGGIIGYLLGRLF